MRTYGGNDDQSMQHALTAEYLELAPEEYEILTGTRIDGEAVNPAPTLQELYGVDDLADLAPVPIFLQQTGLAYTDLVARKTRFVNPQYPWGTTRAMFQNIPLSYAALKALVEGNFAAADANLEEILGKAGLSVAELQAWSDQHFADLSRLVVLEAPGGSCDLEQTRLQQLNGDPVDEVTWERVQRFIRLWRKLGLDDLRRRRGAGRAEPMTRQPSPPSRLQCSAGWPPRCRSAPISICRSPCSSACGARICRPKGRTHFTTGYS